MTQTIRIQRFLILFDISDGRSERNLRIMRALAHTVSNKARTTYLTNVCNYSKNTVITNRQWGKRKATAWTGSPFSISRVEGVGLLLQEKYELLTFSKSVDFRSVSWCHLTSVQKLHSFVVISFAVGFIAHRTSVSFKEIPVSCEVKDRMVGNNSCAWNKFLPVCR